MNESNCTCECKVRSLAYCTIDARSFLFTSSKQVTVQILGFTCVMFSIDLHPWTVLQLFCFIFSASINYHFVTKAFNSRCFFEFTRFIHVNNFKNGVSNHDKQVINGLFHGKQEMK